MEQTIIPLTTLFFELIQISLGNRKEFSCIPSAKDWFGIYELAHRQALTGVLFTGITLLPQNQKPPQKLLLKWYAISEQIRILNKRINKECIIVGNHLKEKGFDYTILKGQSMAALYTFPLLRIPGDIDVWLHPAKISECSLSLIRKSVLELAGDKGKLEGVTYCHVHYPLLKDTEVELHFTPSWMNGFADNKRLQKFFMEQVPVQFSNEIELPDISENINSPTIEFNRFYILLHIYRHLFGEGIGLRQLMDYYHVLHHQASEDSIKRTLDILQQMGMTRFASAVMFVMQKVFGLKDNYLILPPDIKEGRFLLSEIMRSGNFGKFDKRIRRSSRMKYASVRFAFSLKRNCTFFKHYPHEVLTDAPFRIWLYFWRKWHGWI